MKFFIALILCIFGAPFVAMADTTCPTVSTMTSVLNPIITGAPKPITLATYDLNTLGLFVRYANNRADYFVGVPRQLIVGRAVVPWTAIASYPTALVQDRSPCPVLSSNGTPILTSGLAANTVSPYVMASCPAISGADPIQLVSVVSAPFSIYLATYDVTLKYLTVQFAQGTSALFTNIPKSLVAKPVIWNSLATYPEALMTEQSACPLLAQP